MKMRINSKRWRRAQRRDERMANRGLNRILVRLDYFCADPKAE